MAPMVRDDEPVPPPLGPSDPPPAGDEVGRASSSDDGTDPAGDDELPDLLTIPGTRRSLFVRIVCGVVGAVLVLFGVVVWITPLVSGAIPLYLAGAVLLGMADPRIARWINRHERRRLPRKVRLWLRPTLRRQLLRAEREAAEIEARGEACAEGAAQESRGQAPAEPRLEGSATGVPEGDDPAR